MMVPMRWRVAAIWTRLARGTVEPRRAAWAAATLGTSPRCHRARKSSLRERATPAALHHRASVVRLMPNFPAISRGAI